MNEPFWLTVDQVVFLHERTLKRDGGLPGIKDIGLLESSLARPKNHYSFGERDIFQLAAVYLDNAKNHCFSDANKRTSLMSASVFLQLNGYKLRSANTTEYSDMMVALTTDQITRDQAAKVLEANCDKL